LDSRLPSCVVSLKGPPIRADSGRDTDRSPTPARKRWTAATAATSAATATHAAMRMRFIGAPLSMLGAAGAAPATVTGAAAAAHAAHNVLDLDRAGLLELKRTLHLVAFLQRLLQRREHDVIGAGLQLDALSGRHLEPVWQLSHRHHAAVHLHLVHLEAGC